MNKNNKNNPLLLLINPKIKYNLNKFNFLPPVALGIIADLTPKNWTTLIIDENINPVDELNLQADLVGITTNTLNISRAYEISKKYSDIGIKVILGGSHASAFPDEAQKYATSVVCGEVETIWKNIINDFENDSLKNLYHSNDFQYTEINMQLFDNKYIIDAFETSRGCINNCAFCGVHVPKTRPYTRKPIGMIINELKNSKNQYFSFIDNNFYGNDDEYLISLFESMLKHNIKKYWQTGVSVNFFKNKELVKLSAKAGAKMLFVGFESDTELSLKELSKKNYIDSSNIFQEYKEIVKSCHKNNIIITGNYMIGLDSDNEQRINERTMFFKELKLDQCACVIVTPLPKTKLFNKYKSENRLLYTNFPEDWKKYCYSNSIVKHDTLSNEKIEQLYYEKNKLFQISGLKIFKTIFVTKSIGGFIYFYYFCKNFGKYQNSFIERLLKIFKK